MAFGFFRRHQKAVIVIMVVLMVAFLLTTATLSSIMDLFSPSRNPTIGSLYGQKLTARDLQEFRVALDLLGRMRQQLYQPVDLTGMSGTELSYPASYRLLEALEANSGRSSEALALLYREAVNAGVTVSEQEIINAYWTLSPERAALEPLAGETPNKSVYREFISSLKVSERTLRRTMEIWLTVAKNYNANLPRLAPSGPELRRLYSAMYDKLDLRMVRFPVWPSATTNPTPEQVNEQFEKFRTTVPGLATKDNPFGFGYQVPNLAALQWLTVHDQHIAAAATPSKVQIEREYMDHAHTAYRGKELWQVENQIAAALVVKNTEAKVAQLMDTVAAAIKATHASWGGSGNFYDAVVASLKGDAGAVLGRKVRVDFPAVPLKQALRTLAEKAQVDAIVFPTNTGLTTISDSVLVTLVAEDITLGEALERITAQVFITPTAAPTTEESADEPATEPAEVPPAAAPVARTIQWCNLRGMENVLFACNDDDLNTFPLEADQTPGLMTLDQIAQLPDLARAFASEQASRSLIDEVSTAKVFTPADQEAATGAMEVGQDGPMMYLLVQIYDPRRGGYVNVAVGRLFWRLAAAEATHALSDEEFQQDVETHRRVANDCRLLQSYAQTKIQAQMLVEMADKTGLSAAARTTGQPTEETGLFARLEQVGQSPQNPSFRPAMIPGVRMMPPDALPMTFELHQHIMDQAFALAPTGEPPYDREGAVGIIEVQPAKLILVAERKRFESGIEGDYQSDRSMLARSVMQQAYGMANNWFQFDTIVKRTGYQPVADQDRRQPMRQPHPSEMMDF